MLASPPSLWLAHICNFFNDSSCASNLALTAGNLRQVNCIHQSRCRNHDDQPQHDGNMSPRKERLALWVSTGFSNVYGAMMLAIVDGLAYTNPNISSDEARRCQNGPISLSSIPGVSGDVASRCRGTGTGDFANEILIARFGLDKMLEFIQESRSVPLNTTWTNWSSPYSALFLRILFVQLLGCN